jgi:hypothetical protein
MMNRRMGVRHHLLTVAYLSSSKEKTIQKARNGPICPAWKLYWKDIEAI